MRNQSARLGVCCGSGWYQAAPAERWSEQYVRDESGLTADDWLAKDGLGQ